MARRQISPGELQEMYRLIGKAVWGLQYLEVALDQFLTLKVDIKTPGAVPKQKAIAMLARNQRATLGASLNKARQHTAMDAALMDRLDTLNKERAWLVHRSVTESGDDLYDDAARLAVLQRIDRFCLESRELHRALAAEVERFMVMHGFGTQSIEQAAEAALRRLKGEDQQ